MENYPEVFLLSLDNVHWNGPSDVISVKNSYNLHLDIRGLPSALDIEKMYITEYFCEDLHYV